MQANQNITIEYDPRNRTERGEVIRQLALKKGLSLSDLAKACGIKVNSLSCIIRGHSRSARVEATIAATLDLRPENLWPDRYEAQAETSRLSTNVRVAEDLGNDLSEDPTPKILASNPPCDPKAAIGL